MRISRTLEWKFPRFKRCYSFKTQYWTSPEMITKGVLRVLTEGYLLVLINFFLFNVTMLKLDVT